MGLFGSKRKSAFDKAFDPYRMAPGQTPPIYGGPDMGEPPQGLRWSEGGKFTGKDALGLALSSIGDIFAQRSGGQAWAAPMAFEGIQRARKAKADAEAHQIERDQNWEDWQRQYDYEAAHPKPVNNDTERDFAWWTGLSPEQKKTYDQFNPVVVQTPAGPQVVPRGRPAIGDVVDDPFGVAPAQGNQPMSATDQYGNTPQAPDQAAQMRAQLVEHWGPVRGESEYQKWLQAFGGGR